MPKLKLQLETVDVLSFPTTPQINAQLLGARLREGVTNTICGPTCQGGSVCCETV